MNTAQLGSDLVLAYIDLLSLAAIVGTVMSFWHLGRQYNRKR